MAIGFVACARFMSVFPAAAAVLAMSLSLGAAGDAFATEVALAGAFAGKAVLVVDGGSPRTVSAGGSVAGVKLLAVEGDRAIVEVDGRRRTLRLGEQPIALGDAAATGREVLTLTADRGGHYLSEGSVNGVPVRFMVDTGATFVSLGRTDAMRVGIDPQRGQAGVTQTANGMARVWKVRLHSVRVGTITLHDVDAVVHAADLPVALLGMSFLSRMDMRRDGEAMTLRRRY